MDILTQYGLPGLIISVLGGVVVFQNTKIEKLYKEKGELQERRYADTTAERDKYSEAIAGFSKTTELLYKKLDGAK